MVSWSKASLIVAAIFLISLSSASVAHGRSRRFVRSYDEPCKTMRLYFHDILYDYSNSTASSTSAVVARSTAMSMNGSIFGTMVVFNDPMTEGKALPPSLEETTVRAQGLYFYDKKQTPADAWFAFSVDLISEKTRDLSVVGGTGDFFMARGDAIEGFTYFRLQMDIKLYECYV
ncbi:hypothetical protein E2562_006860 [Oryza meyeriana var. granulata]|uniref:Dirigent protein n=1 Tax=Oryza meyeriana var. granulata TaxID=110450 RepID=A0A6G1C3W5_9ORYZ|nr:hypothetical protein E2562_006860 [Oryza meyeriana var. granulata]